MYFSLTYLKQVCATTFTRKAFSIMTIQHNGRIIAELCHAGFNTLIVDMLNLIMLIVFSVVLLNVINLNANTLTQFAEYHYVECPFA